MMVAKTVRVAVRAKVQSTAAAMLREQSVSEELGESAVEVGDRREEEGLGDSGVCGVAVGLPRFGTGVFAGGVGPV